MTVPPVPDPKSIPQPGDRIQDPPRDTPPVMVADTAPGTRKRNLPAHDPVRVPVTGASSSASL